MQSDRRRIEPHPLALVVQRFQPDIEARIREEIERTAGGEPRHPLSHHLAPLMSRRGLPTEPFQRMADRVEAEILRRQPVDEEALTAACEEDQGALFELLALAHGPADAEVLGAARRLGGFCARVYLIRDSGALARAGRAPVPEDRLRAAGLSSHTLTEPAARARVPELLAPSAAAARGLREEAAAGPRLPPVLRIRGAILSALLAELEGAGLDLADQRIALTPLRKLWIAWRTK
jgi:phytoene synthase